MFGDNEEAHTLLNINFQPDYVAIMIIREIKYRARRSVTKQYPAYGEGSRQLLLRKNCWNHTFQRKVTPQVERWNSYVGPRENGNSVLL